MNTKRFLTAVFLLLAIVLIGIGVIKYLTKTETPTLNLNQTEEEFPGKQTYHINIRGFAFSPYILYVKKWDTVIWTNLDQVRHTITSDNGLELVLNSPTLNKLESYNYTFKKIGTYHYQSNYYPYAKGQIVVEERS